MNDTEQILAELYQADPSLKAKEGILRPLIAELLAGRPEAPMDPAFRERLKGQLRARMAQSVSTSPASMKNQKLSYAMIGGLVVAVLAIPFVYVASQPTAELAFAPEVRTGGQEEAFGSLSGPTAPSAAVGRGGGGGGIGGGGDAAMAARPQSGGGAGGAAYAPSDFGTYTVPRFVYDGAIEPAGETVQVLARRKGQLDEGSLGRLVGSFDLGDMLNLKSFPGMGLQSVNLAQDRDYGYSVYVDFLEGSVSVNQNWLKWPNPYAACDQNASPSCYENLRIRQDQMPSDADTIAIAEQFLREHGVSTEGYGAPEVAQDWRIAYERAPQADRLSWYFPEQILVVWPLMVQGMPVYEEGGAKTGITVAVDVRTRKPVSVYGLSTQQYDASSYDGQTDVPTLRGALANGTHRVMEYGSDATFVNVPVGAPERGWMRTWVSSGYSSGRELLVPALIFPIGQIPPNVVTWQQAVVVPLAEDLYLESRGGTPMPVDLPVSQ